MSTGDAKSKSALGFLTVVDHPQHGLCGGYLVLNGCGRPLEFHCTSPIKPNRAQQILYGPTLEPFLYGEQIGQTLVAKAKAETLVVCTDRVPVLAVRPHIVSPVALVVVSPCLSDSSASDVQAAVPITTRRTDSAHPISPPLLHFRVGCNELAVPDDCEQDRQLILERIGRLADSFDLAEPFQRIREAIEEAQRAVRQSA
jgi:hypothetical protein